MTEGKEVPLVTLKRKRRMFFISSFMLIIFVFYGIFGVVLPVIISGDYNSAWPHDTRTVRNMIGFYLFLWGLILSPFMIMVFKVGQYYDFYNDRIEVKPFWGQKNIVIPYNQMRVLLYGNYRAVITAKDIPSWSYPIQRYKIQYLEGLPLPLLQHGYENPNDLHKAVQILKEKAFVLSEKKSIYF